MHRNWFMFPPHGQWIGSVVSLVQTLAAHGRSYDQIISTVKDYGPKEGWDEETKRFVKLAAQIARRDANEL